MPDYDIQYLTRDGHVREGIHAHCDDDRQAKVLAHALKAQGHGQLQVWQGARLVYARPQRLFDGPSAGRRPYPCENQVQDMAGPCGMTTP